jgi:hypothetical protein
MVALLCADAAAGYRRQGLDRVRTILRRGAAPDPGAGRLSSGRCPRLLPRASLRVLGAFGAPAPTRCGMLEWPERKETQMHLKTLIDLIAEQAAREAAKRAAEDAPGAVRPCYPRHRGRTIGLLMKILAIMALARGATARYHSIT